jgi:competence protein ComEC
LRVGYGRNGFLLSGDAERPIEREMLAEDEIRRTDVLKVAHHGSRTSSTEDFLSAVEPVFAVISVGLDNSYGHPNRDVVERLRQHRAVVYRTDQDGLITVRSDGYRLHVETTTSPAAESSGSPAGRTNRP